MEKAKAASIIRSIGWLSEMPGDFQDKVIARADLLRLTAGQLIYAAGDRNGGVFGVASGAVELHLPSNNGADVLAFVLGPGRWFGDLAAVTGEKRRLTVIARPRSEIFRLSRAEILRIVEQDRDAWLHFAEMLARNFTTSQAMIDMLKRPDSTERIAALLLILAGSTPPGEIIVRIGQSNLGAVAGVGRSSVNAALAGLEARGWVRRGYGAVEIIDLPALTHFVWGG